MIKIGSSFLLIFNFNHTSAYLGFVYGVQLSQCLSLLNCHAEKKKEKKIAHESN